MKRTFKALLVGGLVPFCAVAAGEAATAPGASSDAATILPKFSVSADVPLLKIAEHRLLEARWAAAAVAHGDYIYVIGGGSARAVTLNSVERFDVRTGKSAPFAKLRGARRQHRAVLVGEKIYVIGGRVADLAVQTPTPRAAPARETNRSPARGDVPSNDDASEALRPARLLETVEIIDLATGIVSPGPAMPEARAAFGCVVLDGKIHVIGGEQKRGVARRFTNRTLVLDLTTGKWSDGIPMPYASESSAVVVDGFVVVAGGYDGQRVYDDVVVFSPEFKGWRALASLHQPSSAHAMIYLGQHLFLFGSYERPQELIAYDLKKKTSEEFTLGYDLARHAAAAESGDKIYVIGGKAFIDAAPNDYVQVFELAKKIPPAK